MCGIVGYVGNNEPQDYLIDGLEKLEYRGYDSAGIAVVNNGRIIVRKTVGPIANLKKLMGNENLGGTTGIGHTRWATHGHPSTANAHPHFDADKSVAIVHNGTIENYSELKEILVEEGYKFQSDTDTEVAVMLLSKFYKQVGDLKKAMDMTTDKLLGTFVLVAIAADEPDTIVAHRRNAPLIAAQTEDFNLLASDVCAVLKHTKDVTLLENGDTVVVKKDGITIYDENNEIVERKIMHVFWKLEDAEKGGYEHFMLKEIHEQPQGIAETLNRALDENGKIKLNGIELSKEDLEKFNKITIVACGTAYHAGLVGQYVFEKIARIPVEVDVASEFRYRDPFVDDKTLFIAISQSGETADTLEAMREAKRKGATVISIVNVVGSTVARESDQVTYTWAGPEISVASTKAYTTQLTVLYLLALYFAELKGTITEAEYKEYLAELKAVPEKIQSILDQKEVLADWADKYNDREDVFYIGRGLDSAVAYEGSLKLKEISYIPSFAIAAGEMKHGTIALMASRIVVIALATQERLFDKMVSNIEEVKARNAHIIAIAKEGCTQVEDLAREVFYIPQCKDEFTPLLSVVPLQLYAYYTAKCRGCEIDKPRNLAKSVTVE